LRLISRPEARELPSEEAVARAEASTWMGEFLDSLDDAARELFVLAEVEGFSRAEIIACTGYTPLVLAVRLRWVRRRFQRFAAAIAARDSGVATSRTMKGEPDSPRDTTKKDET
jgi:DNA-directed RNA polymerase specialized sigma24 family protein